MTTTAAGASPVDCHVRRLLLRLRNGPAPLGDPNLNDEAADVIERLCSEREVQDAAMTNLRIDLRECADVRDVDIERMRRALHEIAEEWAGAECGEPVHAQEAYAIGLARRMYALAVEGLTPNDSISGHQRPATERKP
jgi:hypothetical protein